MSVWLNSPNDVFLNFLKFSAFESDCFLIAYGERLPMGLNPNLTTKCDLW